MEEMDKRLSGKRRRDRRLPEVEELDDSETDNDEGDEDQPDEEADETSDEDIEEVEIDDDFEVEVMVDGKQEAVSLGALKRLAGQEKSLTRKSQEVQQSEKRPKRPLIKAKSFLTSSSSKQKSVTNHIRTLICK